MLFEIRSKIYRKQKVKRNDVNKKIMNEHTDKVSYRVIVHWS